MTIELLYGRGTLGVMPPAGCVPTVIAKPAMPVLADPVTAVEQALANAVGSAPLSELARGKRSACVLICDITRPVPNGLFLPALIRTLLDAGIPREASRSWWRPGYTVRTTRRRSPSWSAIPGCSTR